MEINGQEVEVDELRDDWAIALMEQGIIVKLTVSYWRATSRLRYEELGIEFNDSDHQDFMFKYIELGNEKLLPPNVLRDIRSLNERARRCLIQYSFQTIWGRFVPYSAFLEWKRESDDIKRDFLEFAIDLGNRYDNIVKEVKQDYEKMAEDVWRRIYPNDTKGASASFLESFTSRIIDKIPNRETIVASFKYETTFFSIPLPSFIQEDIAKAEEISRDREAKAEEHTLQMETKRIIAEDYREKKKELVDSFLESTVSFFRHHIAELASHTYEVLRRQDKDVNMNHVKKIKKMISHIKNLNFYNDKEIDSILDDLKEEVSKYKGERDKKVIKVKLRELVDLSKQEYMPEEFNPMIEILDID